jgi:hypothetical protein
MPDQMSAEDREFLARVSARLNTFFAQFIGREPRYRYFQPKPRGPWFGWYTESPTEGARAGMYASFVYRPVGKGSRSGKATRWEYVQEAESWHALRKDARARALRLYRAYMAGDTTPWK